MNALSCFKEEDLIVNCMRLDTSIESWRSPSTSIAFIALRERRDA